VDFEFINQAAIENVDFGQIANEAGDDINFGNIIV